MALKVFDASPGFGKPGDLKTLNAGDSAIWAAPDSDTPALDATANWSKPEVGPTAGDLPVGIPGNDTLIKYLTLFDAPIVWRVIGKNLPGMPESSITLYMDKIVAIRSFDARESQNLDPDRRDSGNNDWGVSNLRQWANSSAPAGRWYSAQHSADAPPSNSNVWAGSGVATNPYNSEAGMLYESTQMERDLVLATDRIYGGYASNGTTCKDKFFPLTTNELGLELIANNGTKIVYFTDNNSRITQCTPQCITHSNYRSNPSSTEPYLYWTATSYPSNSSYVRTVRNNGALYYDIAYYGTCGVRLACNIPGKTRISPEPDGDGCYRIAA